jgi:hypothetical protein
MNPKFLQSQGHTEQSFSAEWSGCGRYLVPVYKDGKICVILAEFKVEIPQEIPQELPK